MPVSKPYRETLFNSLRPHYSAGGPAVSDGATYIGLGHNGCVVAASFADTPPVHRSNSAIRAWVPAQYVNKGDFGL